MAIARTPRSFDITDNWAIHLSKSTYFPAQRFHLAMDDPRATAERIYVNKLTTTAFQQWLLLE